MNKEKATQLLGWHDVNGKQLDPFLGMKSEFHAYDVWLGRKGFSPSGKDLVYARSLLRIAGHAVNVRAASESGVPDGAFLFYDAQGRVLGYITERKVESNVAPPPEPILKKKAVKSSFVKKVAAKLKKKPVKPEVSMGMTKTELLGVADGLGLSVPFSATKKHIIHLIKKA